MITKEIIESIVRQKGYEWYSNGDFNLNIVGVRSLSTTNVVTNKFDDFITVTYKENGKWVFKCWPATTDPGKKIMLNGNLKSGGVARMVPGQYKGSHAIGLHQGEYEALRQVGAIKLYRDADKDLVYDTDKIVTSTNDGINIHCAGIDSTFVDDWSWGCQVFKRKKDFNEFMGIVKKAAKIWGNKFTYTLIEK